MGRRAQELLPVLLAFGALAASGARAGDISAAERLVFMGNDLEQIRPPVSLRYGLDETGPQANAKGEQLQLTLQARDDGGCCAVAAREVGGETFGPLAPVSDAKANPVILYFLERDIHQMQGQTGGQSNYFRRLIRLSLADEATVKDTTIRYGGRDLAAEEVRVVPYAHDPRVAQFGPLVGKSYVFVLAKAVPGGVFQIRTSTAAPADHASPGADTVLTLIDPAAAQVGGGPVQNGN
jgi:hypothetical protein